MKLRKTILLSLVMVLILALAVGCGNEKVNDEKVAVINGEAIYKQELDAKMKQIKATYQQQGQDLDAEENKETLKDLERQVLDEMIDNFVLTLQAEQQGIKVKAKDVENQMEQLKSQFDDEKQFNQALESNNLSLADIEKEISDQIKIDKYIQKAIDQEQLSVSEDEIKNYFDQLVEQQQGEQNLDFESIKPQIEGMLKQEKMQKAVSELLEGLKKDMEIEVLL